MAIIGSSVMRKLGKIVRVLSVMVLISLVAVILFGSLTFKNANPEIREFNQEPGTSSIVSYPLSGSDSQVLVVSNLNSKNGLAPGNLVVISLGTTTVDLTNSEIQVLLITPSSNSPVVIKVENQSGDPIHRHILFVEVDKTFVVPFVVFVILFWILFNLLMFSLQVWIVLKFVNWIDRRQVTVEERDDDEVGEHEIYHPFSYFNDVSQQDFLLFIIGNIFLFVGIFSIGAIPVGLSIFGVVAYSTSTKRKRRMQIMRSILNMGEVNLRTLAEGMGEQSIKGLEKMVNTMIFELGYPISYNRRTNIVTSTGDLEEYLPYYNPVPRYDTVAPSSNYN